jgi:GT2 family glycosyltransferase
MISQPAVSVVVTTWQRSIWLQLCLESLCAQDLHPNEVLVVGRREDREARGLSELCATYAPFLIRWIEVDRPGHIAPVMRGLSHVEGSIVAFLDDDCEPEPAWLAELVKAFGSATVACVGGRVLTPGFEGKVGRDAGSIRWYGQHVGNVAALDLEETRKVGAVMEGNWAWRTPILRSLHFDTALDHDDASMYGLDLCLQAQHLGYSVVYAPYAQVLHHAAPREKLLAREDTVARTLSYARNYTYIGLKHFCGLRRVAFRIWWWSIGERGAYAALAAFADTLMKRTGVRERWIAAMQGRREGVLLWRAR